MLAMLLSLMLGGMRMRVIKLMARRIRRQRIRSDGRGLLQSGHRESEDQVLAGTPWYEYLRRR